MICIRVSWEKRQEIKLERQLGSWSHRPLHVWPCDVLSKPKTHLRIEGDVLTNYTSTTGINPGFLRYTKIYSYPTNMPGVWILFPYNCEPLDWFKQESEITWFAFHKWSLCFWDRSILETHNPEKKWYCLEWCSQSWKGSHSFGIYFVDSIDNTWIKCVGARARVEWKWLLGSGSSLWVNEDILCWVLERLTEESVSEDEWEWVESAVWFWLY